MGIAAIHQTSLPYDDREATMAFYRDTLGFEARQRRRKRQDALDYGRPR